MQRARLQMLARARTTVQYELSAVTIKIVLPDQILPPGSQLLIACVEFQKLPRGRVGTETKKQTSG